VDEYRTERAGATEANNVKCNTEQQHKIMVFFKEVTIRNSTN
jgi:hypothetical protein